MKHPKRPTKRQWMEIKASGLDPSNWYIERDTSLEPVVIHRYAGHTKSIPRDHMRRVAR